MMSNKFVLFILHHSRVSQEISLRDFSSSHFFSAVSRTLRAQGSFTFFSNFFRSARLEEKDGKTLHEIGELIGRETNQHQER